MNIWHAAGADDCTGHGPFNMPARFNYANFPGHRRVSSRRG